MSIALAKDKSGFIWIGTAGASAWCNAPGRCSGQVAVRLYGPSCNSIISAGYLFSGQTVQAIAVDGADRKWIATHNGVWLISPDAQKIIYHFTADSTPLLSNDVRSIAIDPRTGEVFFATTGGLCSFRSTATEGGDHNENVLVFPNPFRPAIRGPSQSGDWWDGAIIKITGMDGRLIYQTNALGGTGNLGRERLQGPKGRHRRLSGIDNRRKPP